jgi:hypothetical protein
MAGAEVHLLDIGTEAYGDCVVLQFDSGPKSRYVLIDGGHSDDKELLLEQFGEILGGAEPFKFDLIMISHAHGDHIGALPGLITDGHIVAEHALIPDVAMAFGSTSTDAVVPDAVTNAIALMREEPPDDEVAGLTGLDALAVDAAALLPRYKNMIARLTKDGTNVVDFGGRDSQPALAALSEALGDIGFEVLGPQQKHLDRTAKLLSGTKADLVAKAEQLRPDGLDAAELDSADVYADLATDAVGRLGHLVNAQSIVCVFTIPTRGRTKRRILLGGDFQFAKPQTTDPIINAERARLLSEIRSRAPFAFAKLSHHGSTNAVDDTFLTAIGDTAVVGICCGRGHPNHPAKDTLDLLAARSASTSWVRTDRSGHVTLTISTDGTSITPRNAKDLSELNQPDAAPAPAVVPLQATSTPALVAPPAAPPSPLEPRSLQREPIAAITLVRDRDTVQCEIPARATSMTIQFDLATSDGSGRTEQVPTTAGDTPSSAPTGSTSGQQAPQGSNPFQIGGGRQLPKLLFLTDTKRLADNLDATAVDLILGGINDGGHILCDLAALSYNTDTGEGIADAVGGSLKTDPDVKQVVIIGSYDVVPSQQVDCVAKETPAGIAADLRANESDGFIVWSDDPYVDIDRAGLADIPISRIPDGHNGKFTLKQLNAEPTPGERRHGIRNSAREFVDTIYNSLPGQNPLLVSHPILSADLRPEQLQTSLAYYMLHGMAKSATSFWGETDDGQFVEAINLALMPKSGVDIAVLGCCWGALPASSTAFDWKPGQPISGRLQNQSIALSLLAAGARGVIGCTGGHYSPTAPPYDGGAGPLHVALWSHLLAGTAPAEALFKAKYDFASKIARLTSPDELAVANKSLNQFTCLGLGC